MGINKAYLNASSVKGSDECLTPRYGVEPIIKHLKAKGFKTIWCPFDKEDSQFVRVLRANGFQVIFSHIDGMQGDFLLYYPSLDYFDCIASNPPFSIKDAVLERLYELGKPFMMLLPQNSLQSIKRVNMFMVHGFEYLGFDRRINYYTKGELDAWKPANHFASGYFCHNVLPEKLVLEKLNPIQEHYHAFKGENQND